MKQKKPMVQQPLKCRGYVWGKWEASAQYCHKPKDMCAKGSMPKVGDKLEVRTTHSRYS